MIAELKIVWTKDAPDQSLNGFPYATGQFVDREGEGPAGSGSATWINLGEEADTTSAQEAFLNSCEWVYSYEVCSYEVENETETLEVTR